MRQFAAQGVRGLRLTVQGLKLASNARNASSTAAFLKARPTMYGTAAAVAASTFFWISNATSKQRDSVVIQPDSATGVRTASPTHTDQPQLPPFELNKIEQFIKDQALEGNFCLLRGDRYHNTGDFLSALAHHIGLEAAREHVLNLSPAEQTEMQEMHGTATSNTGYIGTTTNPIVAAYFASAAAVTDSSRREDSNPIGIVTLFILSQTQAREMEKKGELLPNTHNLYAFFEPNPRILDTNKNPVPEAEFLVAGGIEKDKFRIYQFRV